VRGTPIVLLPRPQLGAWSSLASRVTPAELSPRAQRVHDVLASHGAMFFDELSTQAHLLRTELESALAELVGLGVVNADSFAGLRALLLPAAQRPAHRRRRAHGGAVIGGMDDAGRWALLRRPAPSGGGDAPSPGTPAGFQQIDPETLEHVAMTLLRRYGVVFWRLLEREADWLPPWRDLLRVFHRLEARGDIRGGRFVGGLAGEQFALPEAIPLLRAARRRALDGALICVSGVDPLNLVGTLLPGDKVPALTGNRVLYRDGIPVATLVAGKPVYLTADVDMQAKEDIRMRLLRRR
jgi:ATP-dependent Lhr-like helicase